MEIHRTMAQVLTLIRTPEELEGVLMAIHDPDLPTKPVSAEDWSEIARLKRQFGLRK